MNAGSTRTWDTLLTAVLVVCALTTTGLVVYRQFIAPPPSPGSLSTKPTFVKNWKSQLDKGVRLGLPGAPVQLIEFADFECPFCASFDPTLKAVRDRYPSAVSLTFVHYPLNGHRFAEAAARAAECAGEQGKFEPMHDRLFEGQKEFGLKPWSEFAAAAGVAEAAAFESCMQRQEPVQRVVAGKRLAEQLNVLGTPTVVINGWQLARYPSTEELEDMVKAILAGRSPVEDIQ